MFKKRKTTEVKKVIDVKFEVKEDLEEDREGCLTHLSGFFKGSSNGEKRKMPVMDGINKFRVYVKKLPRAPHPPVPAREVWLSLWGAFLGVGFTALLAFFWKCPMLLGPFGASAVLIYGAYKAPLAQPRNVLMGHFLAACIGVCVHDFFGATFWSIALGVSLALVLMVVTYSIHPPAGATAYVAVQTGGLGVGYMYILNPVLLGAFILLLIGVIFNKLGKRDYPTHWW
ncbi:MAG: HPP family protein [Candidatus Brocadiaceae bacterium]|uniref:HPP family protein n=1 Tax=Candidatus Wunengus sp. YC61 TaxID=3367698 RepID=UPI00271CCBB2|nr:HPP family protein [Candidatus Brocadiaceae bacterium]